jgi:hypothetical protein
MSSNFRSDLIEVALEVRHETARAWLVSDGGEPVWLPKSQCENNDDGTFTMPEWLATEKGFV